MTSRVGHDDDLELESLGAVDREQPDHVGALLLGDGLELGGPDGVELADESDEPFDVRPAQLLVRARQAGELAEVRVPAAAVPLGQDGEVVVVLGHDPLAEPLERETRCVARQTVEALAERPHEPRVALRQPGGDRALEPDEERPPLRRAPEQDEPVVGDPDERRGEHGHERLVVVPVVQEPQVGE